jgi:hypothetical protein
LVVNLKMRNIGKGHAEVWGNTHAGGRYVLLAAIDRDSDGCWRFASDNANAGRFGELPDFTNAYRTRRECSDFVMRWYYERQAEKAIEDGRGFSRVFWHCPCRDALSDMRESGLFTCGELHGWRERMEASGGAE